MTLDRLDQIRRLLSMPLPEPVSAHVFAARDLLAALDAANEECGRQSVYGPNAPPTYAEEHEARADMDAMGAGMSKPQQRMMVAELDATRERLSALEGVAGDIMQHFNEAPECPACGSDGCSDIDAENEHVAGDLCARLEDALRATRSR